MTALNEKTFNAVFLIYHFMGGHYLLYFSIDEKWDVLKEEWRLLLPFDEQLLKQTQGEIGEELEQSMCEICGETSIWGGMLDSESFIFDQERAERFCFLLLKNYWGKVNLFFYDSFHEANFNVEVVNEKIQQFFEEPDNKKALFAFIHKQGEIQFSQLIEFLFAKSVQTPITETGLARLVVFKVGERYFVQPLYSDQQKFWAYIAGKKIYSLFVQQPLSTIERPLQMMRTFKGLLQVQFTKNRVATMIHQLVQHIDYENPKSYALKQLHLLNICSHYSSGRRHFKKLRKCVANVQAEWNQGVFALNDKEQTLLSYILFQEAIDRHDNATIMKHGLHLIEDERLSNHAIELIVDYEEILQSMNPQPHALVKNYTDNYVEHLFFVLLDTLVKEAQWQRAWELVKCYELATCSSIYELIQQQNPQSMLHVIEATVQQDIAVLVDGTTQMIRESLLTWHAQYVEKNSAYSDVAEMTSQHVCNLLKILFYAEQDLLVEKLLAVYKKYLHIPAHFENLRQFIEQRTAVTV